MARPSGWPALFWSAFKDSRNAMVLLDEDRRQVEVNPAYLRLLGARHSELIGRHVYESVVDGPAASPGEWRAAIAKDEFSGVVQMIRSDDTTVTVQYAGHPETVTGRRLVLLVALSTSRSGRRLPIDPPTEETLSDREREVVHLIGQGSTGPEIAEELRISHNTVRTHAHNAMTKTGARSRAHSSGAATRLWVRRTQPRPRSSRRGCCSRPRCSST
jgi:PAS domain S-box-containing protein